jgi:NitT/TauT family transport system permease protein
VISNAGTLRATKTIGARIAVVLAIAAVWEAAARMSGKMNFIAPPSLIVRALFVRVLSDAAIRHAILVAFFEVVCAYAIAVTAGFLVGLAIGWTAAGRRSLYPIVLLLYAIPQVVLLPLFTLGFGIGPAAKIAFGASHGFFPVVVNVIAGMRDVDPLYVRAARAMGADRRSIARDVILPNMAAGFFAALRLAMAMTLLGVVLAELYISTAGIGYYTKLFADDFDPSPLFALVGTLAAVAVALNELARLVERRLTAWKN